MYQLSRETPPSPPWLLRGWVGDLQAFGAYVAQGLNFVGLGH